MTCEHCGQPLRREKQHERVDDSIRCTLEVHGRGRVLFLVPPYKVTWLELTGRSEVAT